MIKANRLRYPAGFLLGILACAPSHPLAQSGQPLTAPSGTPVFDVASIRASVAETVPSHIANSANNGEFNAVNVTLRDLMEVAFALPETQMFGGPDWTATTRFDVKATADPAVTQQLAALPADQARLRKRQMVQALLLDRFKVSAHKENREMPAYSLVIAKGGPKLTSTTSAATALSGGRGRISIKGGNDRWPFLLSSSRGDSAGQSSIVRACKGDMKLR